MKLAVSLALVLATPLPAQGWIGIWTKELAWCEKPWGMWERPFEVTSKAIFMRQEYCFITKAVEIGDDKTAWLLDLHCGAEGHSFDTKNIFEIEDANTLWKWLDDDKAHKFVRCPQ